MATHDKLIYYRSEFSREAKKIEMEITIAEFKIVCRRLASSLGYAPESVANEFGRDKEVGNKKQLKLLFD